MTNSKRKNSRMVWLVAFVGLVIPTLSQAQGASAEVVGEVVQKLHEWSPAEARARLQPILDLEQPAHHVLLGRLLFEEQNTKDAETHLRHAAAASPDDPEALLWLGEMLLANGREADAMSLFEQSVGRAERSAQSAPDDARAQRLFGWALQRTKRYARSIAALERARELAPGSAETSYLLGLTYAFQEKWEPAVRELTAALEHNPGLAYAYFYRGLAAGRAGRKDVLLDDLSRFVDLAPTAPDIERARRLLRSNR